MAEFKRLSEVEQIETASDNATVLIEEGGDIKRVPKSAVGGAGGYVMTLNWDNYDGGVYCYENYDEMYDVLMAGGSVWMDVTAMFAGGGSAPTAMASAGVAFSTLDSVRLSIINWFISDEGLICDGIGPMSIMNGSFVTICFPNGSHNLVAEYGGDK